MARALEWLRAHRPMTRRLAQLYCALLYNANLRGFVTGKIDTGPLKAACVPGLNCYSCPGAIGACPLGALQNAMAESGTRAGTYVLGILLLFSLMLGRTICGWLCPAGMLQELLYKIPTPKIRKSRFTRALTWVKYGILAAFVGILPLWYALKEGLAVPAFCKYICPAGTLEGAVGLTLNPANSGLLAALETFFTQKFVILVIIGLACIFCFRAFCRFLCPLGALYGLFSRVALIGVKVDSSRCTSCGACVRNCRMDVRAVGDRECIHCGECMRHCPADALSVRCGRRVICGPDGGQMSAQRRKTRRIAQGVLLAVLIGALLTYNIILPAVEGRQAGWESSEPIGYAVGDQLEDFSLDLIGGGTFRLSETRGRITVINLWATWCGPCVEELPLFSDVQAAHPEITVLAVHDAEVVLEDVPSYLAGHPEWKLRFAMDTEDGTVRRIVNGSMTLPRTIVLNARGEVVYNREGSMTADKLEAILRSAEESVSVP